MCIMQATNENTPAVLRTVYINPISLYKYIFPTLKSEINQL